jgi:hypothetical protein
MGSIDYEDVLTLDLQAMFQPQQQLKQNSVSSQQICTFNVNQSNEASQSSPTRQHNIK